MIGYVYCILNKLNSKVYIGKTYNSVETRFKEHIQASKRPGISNRPLYKAFNKYGSENFDLLLLGEYEEGEVEKMETYYIDLYNSFKEGYNATLGGDGSKLLSFSKEDIQKAVKVSESIAEAARYLNISSKTLKVYAKAFSVKLKKFDPVSQNSGITEKQAKRIKYDNEPVSILVQELNISKYTVSRIRNGKSWKHI